MLMAYGAMTRTSGTCCGVKTHSVDSYRVDSFRTFAPQRIAVAATGVATRARASL